MKILKLQLSSLIGERRYHMHLMLWKESNTNSRARDASVLCLASGFWAQGQARGALHQQHSGLCPLPHSFWSSPSVVLYWWFHNCCSFWGSFLPVCVVISSQHSACAAATSGSWGFPACSPLRDAVKTWPCYHEWGWTLPGAGRASAVPKYYLSWIVLSTYVWSS